MATLNFIDKLVRVNNSAECNAGVELTLRFTDSENGSKSITFSKENPNGEHLFGGVSIETENETRISKLSVGNLSREKTITFDINNNIDAENAYVDFKVVVFLGNSRFNVIKAEIISRNDEGQLSPESANVLDFVTVDCLIEETSIVPTPSVTTTNTPTLSAKNLWDAISVFDADNVLEIGNTIYQTQDAEPYTINQLININPENYEDATIFYVRQVNQNVVYKLQRENAESNVAKVVDFLLCPTRTPTPTHSPTASVTPSFTPTNTLTPTNSATYTPTVTRSNTPTQTITRSVTPTSTLTNTPTLTSSQTSPATDFNYYYIASNIQGLCYGVQTLIPTILVYDNNLENLLPKIQNAIDVSDWWGFEEIASRLPESGNFSRLYLRRTTDEDNNIIIVTKAAGTGQAFIIENTEEPVCITQTPTRTPTTTPPETPTPTATITSTHTPSITPSPVFNRNIFVVLNRPSEYTEVINNRARYVHIFNSADNFSVVGTLVLNQPIYAETNLEYNDVDLTSQYTLQSFRSILDSEDNQIVYVYSLDSQKFYELKNVQNILVVTAELPTPTTTPTPSPTSTTQPTPTPSQTPTTTPPLTPLPTRTANPTGTPTNSVTPTISPTNSVTPTNTSTPHGTPTPTPTNTNTPTSSKTPTPPPTGTPTATVTPVMLSKVIQISLNRLEIGRNYIVEITDIMNSDSEVRIVPTLQNIIASSHTQNIAVRLDFSGSVAIINLNIKVTDTVNSSVDYNTILVYTNNFQECY